MQVEISPQTTIERRMREVIALGNYETAYLFSEEGLPLAEASTPERRERDRLVEISALLKEAKKIAETVADIPSLKEIVFVGENSRRVVFRFFSAFEQQVVLAVVVSPGKSYRSHTNRLVRTITSVSV